MAEIQVSLQLQNENVKNPDWQAFNCHSKVAITGQ